MQWESHERMTTASNSFCKFNPRCFKAVNLAVLCRCFTSLVASSSCPRHWRWVGMGSISPSLLSGILPELEQVTFFSHDQQWTKPLLVGCYRRLHRLVYEVSDRVLSRITMKVIAESVEPISIGSAKRSWFIRQLFDNMSQDGTETPSNER